MALLTETYEVWVPMPGQQMDPALPDYVPPGQRRYYLDKCFTDSRDAMSAAREASGAAVTKNVVVLGSRTVVTRPV